MNARRRKTMSEAEAAFLTGSIISPALEDSEIEIESSTIPLEEIGDRAAEDTRPLNQSHVEALAESIMLLGLIEPLVVDSQGRLLAGAHRRAAISYLRETQPEIFAKYFAEGVPVHRLGFDAELQADLAIQIEVAENEQRRDYTPAEVRAIADRFREAGYGVKGRPGKGQSPLIPALMAVVGKSRTTVKRYLYDDPEKSGPNGPDYDRLLKQAHKVLSKWSHKPGRKSDEERRLAEMMPEVIDAIAAILAPDQETHDSPER